MKHQQNMKRQYEKLAVLSERPWLYFDGKRSNNSAWDVMDKPYDEWHDYSAVRINTMMVREFYRVVNIIAMGDSINQSRGALMMNYMEDWLSSREPFRNWDQLVNGQWVPCIDHPDWHSDILYQRTNATVTINGYVIDSGVTEVMQNRQVYVPAFDSIDYVSAIEYNEGLHKNLLVGGMIYVMPYQAAARAKAMLGIYPYSDISSKPQLDDEAVIQLSESNRRRPLSLRYKTI